MNGNNSTEKDLLTLLTKGDKTAFEKIYHLYSGRLLGFLLKLVKSEEHSTELLQEIFIKIWNSREAIDPERSFRSYIFRVAENTTYDFFRKVAREKKLYAELMKINEDFYSHVEEAFFSKENQEYLQNVINTLPPKRRQVFRLIKMEDYSYEEVSVLLNISTSTISDHIVKANKFVEQRMKGWNKTSIGIITLLFF